MVISARASAGRDQSAVETASWVLPGSARPLIGSSIASYSTFGIPVSTGPKMVAQCLEHRCPCARRTGLELERVADPIVDGLHLSLATRHPAEAIPCLLLDLIDLAVAARIQILQRGHGQSAG